MHRVKAQVKYFSSKVEKSVFPIFLAYETEIKLNMKMM